MPWIRIDDHYDEHPKLAAVGPVGWGVWLAGLAYCNRNLTDGFIPYGVAEGIGGSWKVRIPVDEDTEEVWSIDRGTGMHGESMSTQWVIDLLVKFGLWDEVIGGYRVHDYGDYQPTKAQVLAERAAKAAAGRAGGLATATARGRSNATALDAPLAVAKSQPKPVPTPVPVPNGSQEPTPSAREADPEPEGDAVTWLANHKVYLQPHDGYYRHLVMTVERHGLAAVLEELERVASAGMPDGDSKGYVFGVRDELDRQKRPDLRAVERAEERDADADRRADRFERVKVRAHELGYHDSEADTGCPTCRSAVTA